MKITKRAFVSFDEPCQYQCKHCYTYGIVREHNRSIEEILNDISNQCFDVIYVSQKNDNFSNQQLGLALCEKAFDRFSTNLFIITRSVLEQDTIYGLKQLQNKMKTKGKELFIAVSLNAIESYSVSENPDFISSPMKRIEFIKVLAKNEFHPILMLRPILPNSMIPIEECINIVKQLKGYVSCVVSGELGVNKSILERLHLDETDFEYNDKKEYLQGAIDCSIRFINADRELAEIRKICQAEAIPFFLHSMPALNYIGNCK